MAFVRVEVHLSTEDLLKAIEQLPWPELERFVEQVLILQAQRRAPHLSRSESELLLKINEGLPAPLRARYDELIAKRQANTLSAEEYEELLRLSDQAEQTDAQRVGYLAELAQLRQTTLAALVRDLDIHPTAHS